MEEYEIDYMESLYLELLKDTLLDVVYEPETDDITGGTVWPKRAVTMIGRKRLNNLQFCVTDVLAKEIEGDFIETGVWRGGASIFVQCILKARKETGRRVFVADSFEGLPPPDAKHPLDAESKMHEVDFLRVNLEQVKDNFKKFKVLDSNVVFLKGWFKDTLPTAPIEKLAVLRLDGDLYGSTWDALEHLYPKVSKGGYIIIDDYTYYPCKAAVTTYREKYGITDEIKIIDAWGAYWRKS